MMIPGLKIIRILKSISIKEAQNLHKKSRRKVKWTRPEQDVAITLIDKGGKRITIDGHVEIAHTSWDLSTYSATLDIHNLKCECELSKGVGIVDFTVMLLHPVNLKSKITELSVKVNIVKSFNGADINAFIQEFTDMVVKEWNAD